MYYNNTFTRNLAQIMLLDGYAMVTEKQHCFMRLTLGSSLSAFRSRGLCFGMIWKVGVDLTNIRVATTKGLDMLSCLCKLIGSTHLTLCKGWDGIGAFLWSGTTWNMFQLDGAMISKRDTGKREEERRVPIYQCWGRGVLLELCGWRGVLLELCAANPVPCSHQPCLFLWLEFWFQEGSFSISNNQFHLAHPCWTNIFTWSWRLNYKPISSTAGEPPLTYVGRLPLQGCE